MSLLKCFVTLLLFLPVFFGPWIGNLYFSNSTFAKPFCFVCFDFDFAFVLGFDLGSAFSRLGQILLPRADFFESSLSRLDTIQLIFTLTCRHFWSFWIGRNHRVWHPHVELWRCHRTDHFIINGTRSSEENLKVHRMNSIDARSSRASVKS